MMNRFFDITVAYVIRHSTEPEFSGQNCKQFRRNWLKLWWRSFKIRLHDTKIKLKRQESNLNLPNGIDKH